MNEKVPLGIGNEKRIFLDGKYPERITAEYREKMTDEEIKGVYYFAKLIHLIFPDNYPNVFKAGNNKSNQPELSSFEGENIERDEVLVKLSELDVRDEEYLMGNEPSILTQEETDEMEKLEQKRRGDERIIALTHDLREAGIPVDNQNVQNFSILPDDSVVYLDIIMPFRLDEDNRVKLLFNTEKMFKTIAHMEDEEKRERAITYLSRLMTLYESLYKPRAEIVPNNNDQH